MRAFRLVKMRHASSALDGEGARRVGGRWNAPGKAVAYCASSLSLAVLELLVHVDPIDVPNDLLTIEVEIPEHVPVRRLAPAHLPEDWRQERGKKALQALGASWIADGIESVLIVPSVVIPSEANILINPLHPDASQIRVVHQGPFALDPRLL